MTITKDNLQEKLERAKARREAERQAAANSGFRPDWAFGRVANSCGNGGGKYANYSSMYKETYKKLHAIANAMSEAEGKRVPLNRALKKIVDAAYRELK